MNKFWKLELFPLIVILCFFSCKNINNPKNCKEKMEDDLLIMTDEQKIKALVGTWQTTSELEENQGGRTYPIHPDVNLNSYILFAFSSDGKFYMATKSIDNSNGKTYLIWQKKYDGLYTVNGNVISIKDDKETQKAHFTLRGNYLTTIMKSYIGKLQVRDFKKVESPTIEEILQAPTE